MTLDAKSLAPARLGLPQLRPAPPNDPGHVSDLRTRAACDSFVSEAAGTHLQETGDRRAADVLAERAFRA